MPKTAEKPAPNASEGGRPEWMAGFTADVAASVETVSRYMNRAWPQMERSTDDPRDRKGNELWGAHCFLKDVAERLRAAGDEWEDAEDAAEGFMWTYCRLDACARLLEETIEGDSETARGMALQLRTLARQCEDASTGLEDRAAAERRKNGAPTDEERE